jgi:hypothetical protein
VKPNLYLLVCPVLIATSAPAQTSPLELTSSDPALAASFAWARKQALQYAHDGSDPVGYWYEAALPNREAFCMRDVSHQAMGGYALGLHPHNRNMLRKFAENISESKDWCSYWEMNRYDKPAPVDYHNDKDFWYNLPANFDVLDACYRMYLWSGDRTFLDDPAFLNFYRRTVQDYVARWDLGLDRIMHRQRIMNLPPGADPNVRFARTRGIPSYEEGRSDFTVAADLIGAQVAGYRAYALIQQLKGNRDESNKFAQLSDELRAFLNTTWWDESTGSYYSFLNQEHKLVPGRIGTWALYFRAASEQRIPAIVKSMLGRIQSTEMNVEGQSHLPEILYRYGRPEEAYAQILDLTRKGKPRREYPEVSYAVIGAMVTGLMGVDVAEDGTLTTLPRLTSKTGWVEMRNLPVRANTLAVRHDGLTQTTIENLSGPSIRWSACFPGSPCRQATIAAGAKMTLSARPPRTHGNQ